MRSSVEQVRAVLGDVIADGVAGECAGYSIDSRTLRPGELFFAVRGENFDGHAFVTAALEKGAVAAVVAKLHLHELSPSLRGRLIAVENTLDALHHLAHSVREQWNGKVIGVTGSVGKTTTKEAIAQVLGSTFSVLKSHGNLNNAFGMPLQLLKVEPADRFAVLEMGMSSAGEIAALARIARPDWGVVTTVAAVHTEFFADGIEGVARAKRELIEALPADGIAFLNSDDPRVAAMAAHAPCRVVRFGVSEDADVRAANITSLGADGIALEIQAGNEKAQLRLQLLGAHNVTNVLAAIAIGLEAGIPLETCAQALAAMAPPANRGQSLRLCGAFVINDCYNSNPRALKAMVDALAAVPAKRRIVVAGEMLELGADSRTMHTECGAYAAKAGADIVIGVRGNAIHIVEAARAAGGTALFFDSAEQAGEWLATNIHEGDAVLLKASRGVRLERAIEVCTANCGEHVESTANGG